MKTMTTECIYRGETRTHSRDHKDLEVFDEFKIDDVFVRIYLENPLDDDRFRISIAPSREELESAPVFFWLEPETIKHAMEVAGEYGFLCCTSTQSEWRMLERRCKELGVEWLGVPDQTGD